MYYDFGPLILITESQAVPWVEYTFQKSFLWWSDFQVTLKRQMTSFKIPKNSFFSMKDKSLEMVCIANSNFYDWDF